MGDDRQHLLTRPGTWSDRWVEFECGACGVDMDFFDKDIVRLLLAVAEMTPVSCLKCGHSAVVTMPFNTQENGDGLE